METEILKVFTAEQMIELCRGKIISDDTGLTNWNEGSRIRSMVEAFALIESSTGFDYVNALRKSIPVMMYEGFGFKRKGAEASYGYINFYRLPKIVLTYTGSATSCLISITSDYLTINAVGVPGDAVSISLTSYPLASEVIERLNLNTNYSATLIGSDTDSASLYKYSSSEIYGKKSYTGSTGFDIMLNSASAISAYSGLIATINDVSFQTTGSLAIAAGDSWGIVQAKCMSKGSSGNIRVKAIDTYAGKGVLSTYVAGVEHIVNLSAFAGGSDQESEIDRKKRFQYYIKGLAGSTECGIIAAVLGVTGIKSVSLRDNYPQRGQFTVVADDGTGNLSLDLIQTIIKTLDGDPSNYELYPGCRAAGITSNVQAPVAKYIDITLTVYRIGTITDEDEIIYNVKTAIEQYVNTRRLGQDVVLTELSRVAKASHAAIYDLAFSTPTGNVPADKLEILRTGAGTTGTVSVNVITLPTEP